jgi:hypothetical protein
MTNDRSQTQTPVTVANDAGKRAPRVALAGRWSSVRTQPRLVTFSWGSTSSTFRR